MPQPKQAGDIIWTLKTSISLLSLQVWVMPRLTTGIRSEKCVVRRFRRYANVRECAYTYLDSMAYYTPRLYDYILITNLMHQLLFVHKITFSSTFFEPQVLIFRRIQLYTCSILYCHSLWEFLVAWVSCVRTFIESDSTICCTCTTVSSWRWALEARNM